LEHVEDIILHVRIAEKQYHQKTTIRIDIFMQNWRDGAHVRTQCTHEKKSIIRYGAQFGKKDVNRNEIFRTARRPTRVHLRARI
jgi:hypothetical protein